MMVSSSRRRFKLYSDDVIFMALVASHPSTTGRSVGPLTFMQPSAIPPKAAIWSGTKPLANDSGKSAKSKSASIVPLLPLSL